jgi:hypothetical protein
LLDTSETFIAVEIVVGSSSVGLLKEGKGVRFKGELPTATALLPALALLLAAAADT